MRTTSGADWIWRPTRFAVYARDGFICLACGVDWSGLDWDRRKGLSIDHVIPRSRGGSNLPRNLITLCNACNTSRYNLTLRAWARDRGLDVEALMRRVRNATRRKVDYAKGREICAQVSPNFRGLRPRPAIAVGSEPF